MRRRLALVLLLIAEGLALGVAFDSESVLSLRPGWWTPVFRLAGSFMGASLALLVALVLVGWSRGATRLALETSSSDLSDPSDRPRLYAGLHLGAFGVLWAVSRTLFDGHSMATAHAGTLVVCWLFTIAVTLTAWLFAVWSPVTVARWVRQHALLLGGAVGLAFAAVGVGRLSQGLWMPLRRATFVPASLILGAITDGAFADPSTLTFGTSAFAVEVAAQCSGYEGVGLVWTFMIAALWLFRERFRFPHAFILVVVATALTLLANVLRLTALVLVGTYISPRLAAGGFHSYAGSILFCVIALGTISVGLRARWLTRTPALSADEARAPRANPAARYLLPFLIMTAAGLASGAFSSSDAEPLYPLRPLAGALALLAFRKAYRTTPMRISGWAVLAGLGVAAGWLALDRLWPAAHGEPARAALGHGAMVLRAATAILIVPPVEELAFRGYLARRFSGAEFQRIDATTLGFRAIALSALAFGLLHRRPLAGFAAGVAYGLVYRRRGRLADAVIAHAITNASLVALAWLMGAWDLWK